MTFRAAAAPAIVTEFFRDASLSIVVWGVALFASFFNLLNFNNYPLFRIEVGLFLIGASVVALLMGSLHMASRPRLSFLLTGLFTAAIVDMNASIETSYVYAIWAAVSAAAFFRETIVLKIVGAAFGSVALFQLIALVGATSHIPPRAQAATVAQNSGHSDRAPIVHIVLDSYLGLEGMRADRQRFGRLLTAQQEFYSRHNFQAFDGAYSRHVKTLNSLPHAFSYGRAPLATTSQNKQNVEPAQLDYFTDLANSGYTATGLMPDFVDLCANQKFADCRLFMRSGLHAIADAPMTPQSKAAIFASSLLTLSTITVKTGEAMQNIAKQAFGIESRRIYNRTKLFPLTSSKALVGFSDSLKSIDYGEMRFVHLLLPHDPYIYNADCTVKPEPEWLDEHGPGSLAERDEAYSNQTLCTLTQLDKVMAVLDATPAGRAAIVVMHGDHGSRVVDTLPLAGKPGDERTEIMSYSTQFAIRVPGQPGRIVPGRFALDELLEDFAKRDFASAPRPPQKPAWVLPMDKKWIPQAPHLLREYSPPQAEAGNGIPSAVLR